MLLGEESSIRIYSHSRFTIFWRSFAGCARSDPLRGAVLVVPVAPDLADLPLPVELLHLLVLVLLAPPAAPRARPAVQVDPDAGEHDQEHEQDGEHADNGDLHGGEERPEKRE